MLLKNKIIEILEENRNSSISGQDIAKKLSVSRTAVWKNINVLKKEGYVINATTNKGYTLEKNSDVISSEGIRVFLKKELFDNQIYIYNSIDSTNLQAKIKALEGASDGTVIISEEQTSGYGRFGRSFFSPAKKGIYMSIIYRPNKALEESVFITVIAAVAVCRAIEKVSELKPQIKWVNDIFVGDKKVCGILTEAVSGVESGISENIIVGIGINVKTDECEFPIEIKNSAGSLSDENISRNQLIAEIINEISELSRSFDKSEIIKQYKSRSNLIGRNITYTKNENEYVAKAIDINDEGHLVVENIQGQRFEFQSGEIKITDLNF